MYASEPSLCVYVGCTDSMATNFNPSATADDASCSFTRAIATIASFGTLRQCATYVDVDNDQAYDAGEPTATSSDLGRVSIVYKAGTGTGGGGATLSVRPGPSCTDSITGAALTVPLLSEVAGAAAHLGGDVC